VGLGRPLGVLADRVFQFVCHVPFPDNQPGETNKKGTTVTAP
jgi:hypothetical protein